MVLTNTILILGAGATGSVCLHPRLLRSRLWHATVTPLASIIGSGFLVVGPILSDTAGSSAWQAMVGLCLLGYLYGAAVRHNITHIEPCLGHLPRTAARIERISDLTLALSYFVSVSYYLNLLAAFALRSVGVINPFHIHLLATGVIAAIGMIGMRGGLGALEKLEVGTVGIKLAVIAGLLASLAVAFGSAWSTHDLVISSGSKSQTDALRIILGLVILVQGFETSRYLGEEYDRELRVRTMRLAQWVSSAIYIGFVFLITHLFRDGIGAAGGETEIIDMLKPLGAAVAPMLIMAALASQSSAAVADMNGAGGLINEVTRHRVPVKLGYLATALVAIFLTWSANIFEIITWASKSFVAYYALQSLQAALSARSQGRWLQAGVFATGVLIAVVVIVWAVPAGA